MKPVLPSATAKSLLASEYARLKSPDCTACRVPNLFWGPAPTGFDGLWYLRTLPRCAHGCHDLVARIWNEITTQYRIEGSPDTEYQGKRHAGRVTSRG